MRLMDAGIDRAVVKYFGEPIMARIQQRILEDYLGEQPVGTCFIIPTNQPRHPYVAHPPTMRIPMNIAGTDYVYLAMWATLLEVRRFNRTTGNPIETLVCPVFGAGSGGVDFIEASLQLRLAYEHFRKPPAAILPSCATKESISAAKEASKIRVRTKTEIQAEPTRPCLHQLTSCTTIVPSTFRLSLGSTSLGPASRSCH